MIQYIDSEEIATSDIVLLAMTSIITYQQQYIHNKRHYTPTPPINKLTN